MAEPTLEELLSEPSTEVEAKDGVVTDSAAVDDAPDTPSEKAESPSDDGESGIPGVDPASVPPELQPLYQQMVKGMNEKFREAAEERKKLQEKVSLLDKVLEDPETKRAFFSALGQGEKKPAEGGIPEAYRFNPHPDLKLQESFDDPTFKSLEAFVGDFLEKKLLPRLLPYEQAILQLWNDREGSQWTGLEGKYPGVTSNRTAIEDFRRQNPNLSLEQAIYAVMGEKLLQAKKPSETTKQPPRQPVSLTKQATAPVSRVQPKAGQPSMADLVRDEAKRLGIKFG